MAWSRILGQARVKDVLRHAIRSGRVPHAYLFTGPEGVGKDAAALEFARVLHCERGGDEACDTCASCRKMDLLQHPDVHLVVPLPRGKDETAESGPLEKLAEGDIRALQDEFRAKGSDPYHRIVMARATVIKVNSIRQIRREVPQTTSDGRRRVTIISQAELMNDEASNMLLKTLEEPSGDNVLILTSKRRDQLLPTIQSRCQAVRFDLLSDADVAAALQERQGVDEAVAMMSARLASGSYTRAVELLSDDLLQLRQDVVRYVRYALSQGVVSLLEEIDRVADLKDRVVTRNFLLLLLLWFRDALVTSHGGSMINTDQQDDLKRFVARFPDADLPRVLHGIERALTLLDRNVNVRLLLINIALLCKAAILGEASVGHPGMLTVGENA